MLIAKLKSAVLVLGLLLAGAVVVAQQAEIRHRATPATPTAGAAVHPGPSEIRDLRPTEEEAVTRELNALDLGLLAEEVGQLREVVRLAIEGKIRAERRIPAGTGEDSGPDEGKMKAAGPPTSRPAPPTWSGRGSCGERELRKRRRRLETGRELPRIVSTPPRAPEVLPDNGPPVAGAGKAAQPSTAVGSVDMDAVLQRFEKTKQRQQGPGNGSRLERRD